MEEAPTLNAAAMPSANVNVAVVGLNPATKLSRAACRRVRARRNSPRARMPTAAPEATEAPLEHGAFGAGTADSAAGRTLQRTRSVESATRRARGAHVAGGPGRRRQTGRRTTGLLTRRRREIHLAPRARSAIQRAGMYYTLAVQMPNITSYVGSWIMWFAERTPQGPRRRQWLRPPVPIHKVDPKYYQAAIAERVEGKVQLAGVIRTDGHVDMLRILKSVDSRLDRSAAEALMKWEFEPAERNGAPVEVDVVAEIPFLLAPQAKR